MRHDHAIRVPIQNVVYLDLETGVRTPLAEGPLPPAPHNPARRLNPHQLGTEAGRAWAEALASFEQLDALHSEFRGGLAPLFVHAFVDAALEVRAEADKDFIDAALEVCHVAG